MLLTSNQPAQSRGRERRRSHPEGLRVPARPLASGRPAPGRRPGSAPPALAPDGPSAAFRPAVTPLHQSRTPRKRPHADAPGSWRDLVARSTGRFPFEDPSGVHRESRHTPRAAHTVGHDGHAGRAECFRHTEQPERAPDVRRAPGVQAAHGAHGRAPGTVLRPARHGSTSGPAQFHARRGPTPNGWPYAGCADTPKARPVRHARRRAGETAAVERYSGPFRVPVRTAPGTAPPAGRGVPRVRSS